MKAWVKIATQVKKMMVKAGNHQTGARYGKAIAAVRRPQVPQWKGGPKPIKFASPLMMALLRGRTSQ